jgi:hypothetical protein
MDYDVDVRDGRSKIRVRSETDSWNHAKVKASPGLRQGRSKVLSANRLLEAWSNSRTSGERMPQSNLKSQDAKVD